MTQSDKILSYLEKFSSAEEAVLAELNRETHLKTIYSQMVSGHIQGKLLQFISQMIRPKYILEIGTFTGYSAICMAKGLAADGKLITIEINDEITYLPEKYFRKAGISDKIELLIGDALSIIPDLKHQFDLVFIDAEKKNYKNYFKAVISKVKSGGFILADNVLWGGKVVEDTNRSDQDTKCIKEFNEYILQDGRVENFILPLRDGISIIRKK